MTKNKFYLTFYFKSLVFSKIKMKVLMMIKVSGSLSKNVGRKK